MIENKKTLVEWTQEEQKKYIKVLEEGKKLFYEVVKGLNSSTEVNITIESKEQQISVTLDTSSKYMKNVYCIYITPGKPHRDKKGNILAKNREGEPRRIHNLVTEERIESSREDRPAFSHPLSCFTLWIRIMIEIINDLTLPKHQSLEKIQVYRRLLDSLENFAIEVLDKGYIEPIKNNQYARELEIIKKTRTFKELKTLPEDVTKHIFVSLQSWYEREKKNKLEYPKNI